jgi:hypothetical protein
VLAGSALLFVSACGQQVAGQALAVDHPTLTRSAPPSTSRTPVTPRPTSTPRTSSTGSVSLSGLEGVWEGEYTCGQGNTGLRLTIKAPDGRTLPAVFEFFPLPDNPSAAKGSFTMLGGVNAAGKLVFKQQGWIDQPAGYVMVDLQVTSPIEGSVDALSGDMLADQCKGFSVRRSG